MLDYSLRELVDYSVAPCWVIIGKGTSQVGRVSVGEGVSKLTTKEFAIIVIPLVHGTGSSFSGKVSWIWSDQGRIEKRFPNGR
jgi:hypothetical protein